MSDIISARCFGCGNIIKVPAALGGKKARCPQCTNTISIPMGASDTQYNDIISDAELPEVAREGEPVRAEEGDAPIPGQEPERDENEESDSRRRGGTSVRGRAYTSGSSLPRASQQRGTATRSRTAPSKSNPGMIIGIVLGVLALIVLAVVASGGGHKQGGKGGASKKEDREKDKDKETPKVPPTPQYGPEEQALVNRVMDYATTVNRAEPGQILRFYAYEPDDERKVRIRIAQELVDKKVAYEGVKVTAVSASGGSGTVTFSHNGGSKTLQWKQVDNVWMIGELPSP